MRINKIMQQSDDESIWCALRMVSFNRWCNCSVNIDVNRILVTNDLGRFDSPDLSILRDNRIRFRVVNIDQKYVKNK